MEPVHAFTSSHRHVVILEDDLGLPAALPCLMSATLLHRLVECKEKGIFSEADQDMRNIVIHNVRSHRVGETDSRNNQYLKRAERLMKSHGTVTDISAW